MDTESFSSFSSQQLLDHNLRVLTAASSVRVVWSQHFENGDGFLLPVSLPVVKAIQDTFNMEQIPAVNVANTHILW